MSDGLKRRLWAGAIASLGAAIIVAAVIDGDGARGARELERVAIRWAASLDIPVSAVRCEKPAPLSSTGRCALMVRGNLVGVRCLRGSVDECALEHAE